MAFLLAIPASGQSSTPNDHIAVTPDIRTALGLESVPVQLAVQAEGYLVTGRLMASPDAMVHLLAPARLTLRESLILPGQRVEAGELIYRFYSPELVALDAERHILSEEAMHAAERAERASILLDAGLTSLEDVHELELRARAAERRRDAIETRFAGLTGPQTGAEFELRAPQAGQVIASVSEAGTTVEEGERLVALAAGSGRRLQLNVPEAIAMRLEPGSPVRVEGMAGDGEVIAIGAEMAADSRSIVVTARAPGMLSGRPLGALINVTLAPSAQSNALSIPARALVRTSGGDIVFVDAVTEVIPVDVTVLSRTRDEVLLEQGDLQPGQRVVTSGTAALKNIVEGG